MNRARAWIVTGAAAAGAMIGTAGIALAAGNSGTATPTPSASSSSSPEQPGTGTGKDPADAGHGPGETLLTGDTAAKVKAAALAAVPGGTIIRVETDSGGAVYEAHMKKADGTEVTVKFDANFKVTATEAGHGKGPAGGGGHH
jgi:hypothetical protein